MRTARLTVRVDRVKKQAFGATCVRQDVTPWQRVRRLTRYQLGHHDVSFLLDGEEAQQENGEGRRKR